MNKFESKYFNTALKMDNALLDLLTKKDFEYITVKDICEKANVNRSTFYLHYENTYDLFEESVLLLQNNLNNRYGKENADFATKITYCDLKDLELITSEYLKPYLSFVKENAKIYKAIEKNKKALKSDENMNALFETIFAPILERFKFPKDKQKYIISFHISGIMSIIFEWIKNDYKEAVEEIIEIIINCVYCDFKQWVNIHE